MNPKQVSSVIIGNWNPKIFTPAWVKSNLFGISPNAKIQGLLNYNEMEFGFQYNGVIFLPKPNLIEINFDDYDEQKAILTASTIIRILELLPQTPLKAMGINYRFDLDLSSSIPFILALKKVKCSFEDFQLTQIKQTSNRSNYQINIISDFVGEKVNTNFNFHYSNIKSYTTSFIKEHFQETQIILKNGN